MSNRLLLAILHGIIICCLSSHMQYFDRVVISLLALLNSTDLF